MPTEYTTPTSLEQDDTVELPTLPRAPAISDSESRLAGTDTWTAVPLEKIERRGTPRGGSADTTTFAVPILSETMAAAAVEPESIPAELTPSEPVRAEPITPLPRPVPPGPYTPVSVSAPRASAASPRERGSDGSHERAERYFEVLQSLEARRQLFDAMLAEREVLISERDRRIVALERQIDPARREAAAEPIAEPDASASAAVEARVLTDADDARALAALLEQAHAHSSELERAITGLRGERDHWQARCEALQFEQVNLQEELQSLRSEHGALRERAAASAVDAARRAAELETQLRARDDTVSELRGQLGAVRDALEQRNALIVRLEADVASSAAVLANLHHEARESEVEPTRMLVQAEGASERTQVLGRRTTIGRTPDNDMRIEADFVSRHHAVVLRHGQRTVIEDLNSTNGTYVNRRRVSRCTLNEGDLVTLGHSDFRFVIKPSLSPAR